MRLCPIVVLSCANDVAILNPGPCKAHTPTYLGVVSSVKQLQIPRIGSQEIPQV